MIMLSTTIEIKRQTSDIQHPMYDMIVNASASVDYDEKVHVATSHRNFVNLFWFMFSRH